MPDEQGSAYGWKAFKTGRLLDCIDPAEYLALDDDAKDGVRIVISAGEINFTEGSPTWEWIHAIFPDDTKTWAAILDSATKGKPRG